MADRGQAFILFHTSNHAFRAEKLLTTRGLACRLVPVPRHLSSDCGVCLRIDIELQKTGSDILSAFNVEVAGIHPGEPSRR